MSLIKLSNGKFVVIDTIPLTEEIKKGIDQLTHNGENIEAVIATHPFHTLAFPAFFQAYPNPKYFGTPRHLLKVTSVKWQEKDLTDCDVRNMYSPEIEMRIPAGAEFVAPKPENSNHFLCVFVFHKHSKTIHVDDTIMYADNPGFLLKLAGFRHGTMMFHLSIKGPGLLPNPESPFQFRDWCQDIIKSWDFDNICTAHMGNKVGGAKAQLQETLNKAEPLFKKLHEQKKNNQKGETQTSMNNVSGDECG